MVSTRAGRIRGGALLYRSEAGGCLLVDGAHHLETRHRAVNEQGQGGLGDTYQQSGGVLSEIKAGTRHAVGEPKIRSRAVSASVTYVVDMARW